MAKNIEVTVGGQVREAERGTPVGAVLPAKDTTGHDVLGAVVDNMLVPLDLPLLCDCEASPISITSRHGFDIYSSSIVFLLAKCSSKLFPQREFRVRNSIGHSVFCTIDLEDKSPEEFAMSTMALQAELDAIVERDAPIVTDVLSYADAVDTFGELGRLDEMHLLKHRNPPVVKVTRCEDFCALSQVPLVTHAGLVSMYELVPQADGFILNIPSEISPDAITPCGEVGAYMDAFVERRRWGKVIGVDSVGDLNETISRHDFDEFVRACETLHRKKLAEIADMIVRREPKVRLVLVAGPSSAGKTTTAKRIQGQLMACGRRAMIISTDDYFVGDERNPRDENGKLDYECIGAVDCDLLAADLNALFAGEAVHLRRFDFKKHAGFDAPDATRLPDDAIVIVEGIHALNPMLTEGIDDAVKFRVYLNTFTQLVVDCCNRISTRDSRLIRRIVRDFNYRGASAKMTIDMWTSVMAGEEKWIYPFQIYADAVFNSALDYELAVLKPYATRILNEVKPWDREFIEARRLTGLLHNVCAADSKAVPGDSILRETIGGSQLSY